MPVPPDALIVPALTTAPPIGAPLMVIPSGRRDAAGRGDDESTGIGDAAGDGDAAPMLMQLMLLDVISETTTPEMTLIAHVAANAGGAPLPIISAAEDDANRRNDRLARRRRIEPAKALGINAFESAPRCSMAKMSEARCLALLGLPGSACACSGLASLQQDRRSTERLRY